MRKLSLVAGAAIFGLCGGIGKAQAPETSEQAKAAVVAPEASMVRDPETLAALDKMGAALRKLQNFEVRSDTTEERVLTTGQKIQIGGYNEIRASRPSKLRIDRINDRQSRSLYFDGKILTIYSPRVGFYGSVPATGTIHEAVMAVAENYDVETPLADLFAWGEDPALAAKLESAFYVGAETIGGFACDQYALRQPDVDWQIWIRQKGQALPCKLVITSTDDPSMPQYSAVFTWIPQKTHAASVFTFVPPKGSREIPLERKAAVQAANAE